MIFLFIFFLYVESKQWCWQYGYNEKECRFVFDVQEEESFLWAYTAKSSGENICNRVKLDSGEIDFSVAVPSKHHSKKYIGRTYEGNLIFYASEKPGVISQVGSDGKVGTWEYNTTFDEVMMIAVFHDGEEQYILYQNKGDTLQAVNYNNKKVMWTYKTDTGKPSGPYTLHEGKMYVVTDGPPFYLIAMDPKVGKVLKKVELKDFSGQMTNEDNAHMLPKLTIKDDIQTMFYISNRGEQPSATSELIAMDMEFGIKWKTDLTDSDTYKCEDALISDQYIYVDCQNKNAKEQFSSYVVVMDPESGKEIFRTSEVMEICDKAVLIEGDETFFFRCDKSIYYGDVKKRTFELFTEGVAVYDIAGDLSGCFYYVIQKGTKEEVRLIRQC